MERVLAHPEGAGLTAIAADLGRDRPAVLHHLQALVAEGLVERDERGTRPLYRARAYFSATWVDPASRRFVQWRVSDRVSWRFPLASRIADAKARDATLLFLRQAEHDGILAPPHLMPRRLKAKLPRGSAARGADGARHHGIRFLVYGSAARNDMGAASDVDILALPGPGLDGTLLASALRDVAATVNLVAPRRVDVNTVHPKSLPPPALAAAARRDGFVVYSTYEGGEYDPMPEAAR